MQRGRIGERERENTGRAGEERAHTRKREERKARTKRTTPRTERASERARFGNAYAESGEATLRWRFPGSKRRSDTFTATATVIVVRWTPHLVSRSTRSDTYIRTRTHTVGLALELAVFLSSPPPDQLGLRGITASHGKPARGGGLIAR